MGVTNPTNQREDVMAIPTYNPPRSIHGKPEVIEALIMAARMEGIWQELREPEYNMAVTVAHIHDTSVLHRITGSDVRQIMAWNQLLALSKNFEVTYV